jgi:hypothetical protein
MASLTNANLSTEGVGDPVIDALKRGQVSPPAEAPPASKAAGAGGEGHSHKHPPIDSEISGPPAPTADNFSTQQPQGGSPAAFETAPLPDSNPSLKMPATPFQAGPDPIQFAYTRFITRPRKYG